MLTTRTLSINFSKETVEIEPAGLIGIDRNLDNVSLASSARSTERFDFSTATETKAMYREVKSYFKRNDARVRKEIYSKYGAKQKDKVQQILHHASKQIVMQAKAKKFGIIMENLTGIRKLYRKGNGQGREFRGRMNGWSYYELQRQIEYKARWEGLPVIYVNPSGTSVKCSRCGSRMARIPEENRKLTCAKCGFNVDRDVNAARNILARGLRFRPIASASEAMVWESETDGNPSVDADELTRRLTIEPTS